LNWRRARDIKGPHSFFKGVGYEKDAPAFCGLSFIFLR
jgi:hypothetical protein